MKWRKKNKSPSVKGKRKKRRWRNARIEPSEERKKKKKRWSKVAVEYDSGSLHVVLFTEMPLKTELWKLKTVKMCFQFP